ncbi:MAG TPA: phosphatidate cytidylyltransferase [Bacteroidia bacterium]|nr:phosphatidate cytidylyltransferase [Bacteroidia bacterium]
MKELAKRSLTGIVFIAVVIGSVLYGKYSFAALFFIVNLLALLEFYSLMQHHQMPVQKYSGIIIGSLLYLNFFFMIDALDYFDLLIFFPALFLVVFSVELFLNRPHPFTNIAHTLTGLVYITVPLIMFMAIPFNVTPFHSYQSYILIGYFAILWTSDTFAYLIGTWLGKHRLFERISPKKSWEGVIGGLVFALIAAYILSIYFTRFTAGQWMLIALVIVVTGVIGDLVESMFKRSIQVKDTGHLLPGHGGILDRFDALLFSAPFVFVTVYLLAG